MSSLNVIKYVDSVVSNVDIPDEYKVNLANELIRSIIEASANSNIEAVTDSLCSPEKLAEELTKKLNVANCRPPEPNHDYPRPPHHRYCGEYMHEQSNVNLKLLYIPLIQICSGTERISMPLMDEY